MTKDITIGDKTIKMKSTAALSYRYKSCFHKDVYTEIKKVYDSDDPGKRLPMELIQELGYIMALAGENRSSEATEEGFFEWLDEFEPMDMMIASGDIANLYFHSRKSGSESKKKIDQ